jgi:hypothetical protein
MENFVTLFDRNFLPQGMALYISMERVMQNFTLWIVCMDDECYEIIKKLKNKNIKPINIKKYEDGLLLKIKKQRTRAEYCWTITPMTFKFVFLEAAEVNQVTYLDADMWFMKSPEKIISDFKISKKSVLITRHDYAPENDQSETSGKYCVQFLTIKKNTGEKLRAWWEEKCLEWCFDKFEEDRFGDQKYIERWPELAIYDVHEVEKEGLFMGPWNSGYYPYTKAICYHFHGFRIITKEKFFIGGYEMPKVVIDKVYKKYIKELAEAIRLLNDVGYILKPQTNANLYRIYISLIISRIKKLFSGTIIRL